MFKKVLLSAIYTILSILTLLFLVLFVFRFQANRREIQNPKQTAPSSGKYVRGFDVDIFIQESGPSDGTPILFVHGMGAWSEIWRESMNAFSQKGYRTIAIDLPPFGFSERPDVSKFDTRTQGKRILGVLHSLEISKAILVGHSFGGGPTLHAAILEPEMVNKLVLVDIAAQTEPIASPSEVPGFVNLILHTTWIRNLLVTATVTNPLLTKTLFQSFVFKKEAITDEKAKMIQIPMSLKNSSDYMGEWLAQFVTKPDPTLSEDLPLNVSKMRMPIFILWGDNDSVTPLAQGENLAKLLPGSRLKILSGLGHIPQLEDSNLFQTKLFESLEEK